MRFAMRPGSAHAMPAVASGVTLHSTAPSVRGPRGFMLAWIAAAALLLLTARQPVARAGEEPPSVESAGARPPAGTPQLTDVGTGTAVRDSISAAEALFYGRKYYEAEPMLRRLILPAEAAYGPTSERLAHVLDMLVGCLFQNGKSQSAETRELADRALQIKLGTLGLLDSRTATSLSNLGVISAMGGDLAAADSIFSEVLRIREATLPPDHLNIAGTLSYLANVRLLRSDYAGALPLNRRALVIMDAHGGPENLIGVTVRANIALLLEKLGDYTEARAVLDQQISLLEARGLRNESLGFAYDLLGRLHRDVGDHEEALAALRRSLDIREAFHQPDHPRIAETLLDIGQSLAMLGELDEARREVERGLAIWEKLHGPDHSYSASFYQVLGRIAQGEGRTAEARTWYERSLEIHTKTLGVETPKTAEDLAALAGVFVREGDLAAARDGLTRAMRIVSDQIDPRHPRVAGYGGTLAEVYFLEGKHAEAAARALDAERVFSQHLRLTMRSLPERQALAYAQSRNAALDLALSVLDLLPEPRWPAEAWDALIHSRALVLDEMAVRNRGRAQIWDPESSKLRDAYEEASTRLANIYVRAPAEMEPETYRGVLDDARLAMEEAQRKLSATRTDEWIDPVSTIGWEEVRSALPEGAAIVAYVLYRQYTVRPNPALEAAPRYRAFVLPARGSTPVSIDLGDASRIDEQIAAWKQEASFGALRTDRDRREAAEAYRQAASALRRSIWDPVEQPLGSPTQVFVVPDGQIHLVNLAALPREDGPFLVESDISFHKLTAEREIAQPPAVTEATGALVMGSPDFELTGSARDHSDSAPDRDPGAPSTRLLFRGERPDCGVLRSMRFVPLPGSLEEAREVARLWEGRSSTTIRPGAQPAPPRVRLLTGREATEDAFKRMAPGNEILHVATHGYFLNGDCPSGFAGTRGIGFLIPEASREQEATAKGVVRPQNPLLLSGLALAGANRRDRAAPDKEDGILTAQEIAALDLSSVRWAVLSACETGSGEILNGEGVFGLQRAFRVAGARTLITSLWSVQDETTRQWMNAFYRASMDRGASTIEAVREASRSVLRERRERGEDPHPFYWAAFVASGDWR